MVGTVRTVNVDGTYGEPLFFLDVAVQSNQVTATLDPAAMGVPLSFDWVSRAELGEQFYPFYPAEGHLSMP